MCSRAAGLVVCPLLTFAQQAMTVLAGKSSQSEPASVERLLGEES